MIRFTQEELDAISEQVNREWAENPPEISEFDDFASCSLPRGLRQELGWDDDESPAV